MNTATKQILTYLENCYSGAKMMGDVECEIRISRAIAAFNTDPETRAEELFTDKFLKNWYEGY